MRRGQPLSWRHYVYGLGYLGRAHVRTQLMHAQATRLGNATEDGYSTYLTKAERMTGTA